MAETIAALSTAPVRSGIAVIRISGDKARDLAQRVFQPAGKGRWIPRMMRNGMLLNKEGDSIDSILAVWFAAPNSYTGEDIVELHCHGSLAVLNVALSTLYFFGARPAEPGEFTKRAFLNDRLDLGQAEAVGDLIDAVTEEAAVNATAQLQGALSKKLLKIYDILTDLLAHFQAVVDYPEEDIESFSAESAQRIMEEAVDRLEELTMGYERGKVLKEGIDCAIIGRPNVGKSSLFNALLGNQRAIVTPFAGTTRDVVEAYARIGNVTLKLRDTAGLRDTQDPIEDIGVEKAKEAVKQASLILAVIDGSQPINDEDRAVIDYVKEKKTLLIVNKGDKPEDPTVNEDLQEWLGNFVGRVRMSAMTGSGMKQLEAEINKLYATGGIKPDGTLITNARQEGACRTAELILRGAINNLRSGFPPDMILYDVEQAITRVGEVLGRNTPVDIIDRIFENFCVGK